MALDLMRRGTSNLAMFHPDELLNEVFLGTVPRSLPTPVHHIHTLRDHAADQKTDGHDAEHSPGGQRRDPRHGDRLGEAEAQPERDHHRDEQRHPADQPHGPIETTAIAIVPVSTRFTPKRFTIGSSRTRLTSEVRARTTSSRLTAPA